MLFHTGALIRLNELGLLKQLRRVSSVSGGSISAGYLGFVWKRLNWDSDNVATNFEDEYVAPILRFSRRSIDYICGAVGFFTQGLLGRAGRRLVLRSVSVQRRLAAGSAER